MGDESKLDWVEKSREIYANAINICVKTGNLEKALFYLNSSKAVLLSEQLNKFELAQASKIPPEYFEKEKTLLLNLKMAATIAEKLDLNKEIESLRKSMKEIDPQYFSLLYEIPEFDLKDIQEKLDENTSIIEYLYADENIFAFQITKDEIQVEQIVINENFDSLIRQFKQILIDPYSDNGLRDDYGTVLVDTGWEIYSSLLKPFEGSLTENLVIIPDGPLFDFPFDALPTSKHQIEEVNYGDVSYLLKSLNSSYANSLVTLLKQLEFDIQADENYLGIAPVVFNQYSYLDTLPETENEVLNAQNIFGGNVLLRDKAKLSEFQQDTGRYKIILLATHASVYDSKTDAPTIYFSDTTYDLNQIYASKTNAKLLVLNVCEAGKGEQATGEGVLSLARGFAYNGVPSILTSLSKVKDHSSAFLMDKFYQNINAGERKDVALKNAKLEIINGNLDNTDRGPMPYNWAAFVLVGDTEPLFHKTSLSFAYLGYGSVLFFLVFFGIVFINKYS